MLRYSEAVYAGWGWDFNAVQVYTKPQRWPAFHSEKACPCLARLDSSFAAMSRTGWSSRTSGWKGIESGVSVSEWKTSVLV